MEVMPTPTLMPVRLPLIAPLAAITFPWEEDYQVSIYYQRSDTKKMSSFCSGDIHMVWEMPRESPMPE
jgi:hypothetical protein